MEWICIGKGIVIGLNLIFGLFEYKTRRSCVYNKTAEKQGSLSSFIVWDFTYKWLQSIHIHQHNKLQI